MGMARPVRGVYSPDVRWVLPHASRPLRLGVIV